MNFTNATLYIIGTKAYRGVSLIGKLATVFLLLVQQIDPSQEPDSRLGPTAAPASSLMSGYVGNRQHSNTSFTLFTRPLAPLLFFSTFFRATFRMSSKLTFPYPPFTSSKLSPSISSSLSNQRALFRILSGPFLLHTQSMYHTLKTHSPFSHAKYSLLMHRHTRSRLAHLPTTFVAAYQPLHYPNILLHSFFICSPLMHLFSKTRPSRQIFHSLFHFLLPYSPIRHHPLYIRHIHICLFQHSLSIQHSLHLSNYLTFSFQTVV